MLKSAVLENVVGWDLVKLRMPKHAETSREQSGIPFANAFLRSRRFEKIEQISGGVNVLFRLTRAQRIAIGEYNVGVRDVSLRRI